MATIATKTFSPDPFSRLAKGREVKIFDEQMNNVLSAYPNTHLLLTDEVELQTESTYGPILGEIEASSFLNLIANSIKIGGYSLSGQHTLQSISIWQKSEPIKMSLQVSIPMVTSGKEDVVKPIYDLIKITLPQKTEKKDNPNENGNKGVIAGSLIPPGPNLSSILDQVGLNSDQVVERVNGIFGTSLQLVASRGILKIQIGEYIHLPECIITSVVPTFSKELDEEYFPISCTATIELQTVEVATTQMIEQLSKTLTPKPPPSTNKSDDSNIKYATYSKEYTWGGDWESNILQK